MATPLQAYIGVQQTVDKHMAAVLLDAAEEAERIIKKSAGSKGVGVAVERARMQQASRELRRLSDSLWQGEILPGVQTGAAKAAVAAVNSEKFVGDVLEKALGQRFRALEDAIAFSAANSVDNLRAKDKNAIPLSEQVYRSQALADGWVNKEVQRALALQQSAAQLAERVATMILPSTPGGVSYAANRLARTEINNAFHRAQIDRRSQEPWTQGFKWNLSGSHPKPDECNVYAERVNYKDGPPGVFKPNQAPAKPHPNCLCYLTTVTVSEDDFVDAFLNGDYNRYMDEEIYGSGIGTSC